MSRKILLSALFVCLMRLPAAPKPQLPEQYRHWLDRDVIYIITDEERKAFLALGTNEERDKYIDSFWAIRNPLHSATQNPYKEEHYRRIEYANEHFGRQSNTPGWMTDMGRTWIEFGKPTSQHSFIGYGQIYPLQLWFYENDTGIPSMPPFFYVMFFMPEDIGEYRYYRPYIDGPMKLVRGSQFHTNQDVYKFLLPLGGDVAHAAFSLAPNDPIDTVDFAPDMSSDMLLARIQNFANDPFNVRRIRELRSLREKVSSFFMVAQDEPLDLQTLVLSDPTGKQWLDYGVYIRDSRLGKLDPKTGQIQLSIAYHLLTESGEVVIQDEEDRSYPALGTGADKAFRPFLVANRLPLEPGAYKLVVEISNRDGGRTYRGEQKISSATVKQLSIRGPLLTNSVNRAERPDSLTAFQYFGVQFHPAAERTFTQRDPLGLLFEIQEPAGESQDYQLEYLVASTQFRESRRTFTDKVSASEFKNGALLKSKTIPLEGLEPGDYRVVLNVRSGSSAQVLASTNLPLKVEASSPSSDAPLYFLAGARGLARPGVSAYVRGLLAMSQKNDGAALEYMRQALEQNPKNGFAGQDLVQLYFNKHQFTPISDLYKRLGAAPFQESPVTLAQISLSLGQSGDSAQARDVMAAARRAFPRDPILAAAESSLKKLAH